MEFKEFCKKRALMCANMRDCVGCGFYEKRKYNTRSCPEVMMQFPEEAEKVVVKWFEENTLTKASEEKASEEKASEEKPVKTYEDGLKDAWEVAKMITTMDNEIVTRIFGEYTGNAAYFQRLKPETAVYLYEKHKEKCFKIGDVVESLGKYNRLAVVTDVNLEKCTFKGLNIMFGFLNEEKMEKWKKTGRNVAGELDKLFRMKADEYETTNSEEDDLK